jgi:hypothetical protein
MFRRSAGTKAISRDALRVDKQTVHSIVQRMTGEKTNVPVLLRQPVSPFGL